MKCFLDFLNGPIIPLTLTIGGIVAFIIIYYKENKRVNKHRKEIQQKILEDYQKNEKNSNN